MLKTLIILPDGTELFSGGEGAAVVSCDLTQTVNAEQELTLGSVCSDVLECRLTQAAGVQIAPGDALTLFRVEDGGERHQVGVFIAQKPVRSGMGTIELTAFDRLTLLDKDLSLWLAGLDAWPYALFDFAKMVCAACGIELTNTAIPNGGYPVQKFCAQGITGRQLMQWAGQIAGRFCRATEQGQAEFAWYEPLKTHTIAAMLPGEMVDFDAGSLIITPEDARISDDGQGNVALSSAYVSVSDDGQGTVVLTLSRSIETLPYSQGSLFLEDYTVAPVEKVQLQHSSEDVGTVYPDTQDEVNTYSICGNYLLTAGSAGDLLPVAQTLYEQLKDVSYTPCRVSVPAELNIRPGHSVQITDPEGKTVTAWVMSKTTSGQRATLECTGSARRDSSAAVNNQYYKALSGKVLNLRTDVEGLKVENKDTTGKVAALTLDLEGIRTQISRQQQTAQGLQAQLTAIEQTADAVSISVKDIRENGASKVVTETGYSFSDAGLIISKSGQEMENRLDHTGMYVTRSGQVILQANARGVAAADVTVRSYLIVGSHARFEDYAPDRTACFYL